MANGPSRVSELGFCANIIQKTFLLNLNGTRPHDMTYLTTLGFFLNPTLFIENWQFYPKIIFTKTQPIIC